MNNGLSHWDTYKTHVHKSLKDFGSETGLILSLGIAAEVGELAGVLQKQIIKKHPLKDELLSELGDVLWFMAAIEIYYDLPYPRYSTYLALPLEVNKDAADLLLIQGEINLCVSLLCENISIGEMDEVIFNLNKLLGVILDLCALNKITAIDCINASIAKISIRHTKGYNSDAKKNYSKEYIAARQRIRKNNLTQALFDICIDKRRRNPYFGVILKVGKTPRKKFACKNSDLIVDFFTASNYLADNYKAGSYSINYSTEFRDLLFQVKDKIISGYILEDSTLISAAEFRNKMNAKEVAGNTVYSGDKSRPILMNSKMKNLDDLLEYVTRVRNFTINKYEQ